MAERAGWALILHGGARTIDPRDAEANRAGCLAAASRGADLLRQAASAEATVEAVIRMLEDDPTFNAGNGAVANADGVVQLDAAIMRGEDLAIGAVGALEGVGHPISVARRLLDETAGLLVGSGARAFAGQVHGPVVAPTPATARAAGGDTVGCIVLDKEGHLAVGLSTGGLEGKTPGRLGDTPLPGCGFYADDAVGGVALSGDGDAIARVLLAAKVMTALETQPPQAAAETALTHLGRVGGEAGAIVLDPSGAVGCAHNSQHFAVAFAASGQLPRAILHQDELDLKHD
jgi:beta-aspartyl-peptidase (threonine type)